MTKLKSEIIKLQKVAKSRYKETRSAAKILLTMCENAKRMGKVLQFKIEKLQAHDLERKNRQIIKKEAKAATLINLLQLTTDVEAQTPQTANQMLQKGMCLINYELVNDSKSTDEKAGTLTTRIASRMPEVWHEYKQNPVGARRQNGTICYKDFKMRHRSCADDKLVWIYELSGELSQIFRGASEPMQIFYAKLFTKYLNQTKKKFTQNKVFC